MDMVYIIEYRGEGKLHIEKMPRMGSPRINVFAQYRERDGRIYTEYVPGFSGLSFSLEAWEIILKYHTSVVDYPEWKTDGYEKWIKDNDGKES